MLKLAVLVSGGGTNLQAIIDALQSGSITNGKIVKVIASKQGVFALRRAEERFLIRDIFRKQQPRGCDASGSFRIVAAQNAIPPLRRETRQRCFVRQSGLSPIQFYAHVQNVSAARAAALPFSFFTARRVSAPSSHRLRRSVSPSRQGEA